MRQTAEVQHTRTQLTCGLFKLEGDRDATTLTGQIWLNTVHLHSTSPSRRRHQGGGARRNLQPTTDNLRRPSKQQARGTYIACGSATSHEVGVVEVSHPSRSAMADRQLNSNRCYGHGARAASRPPHQAVGHQTYLILIGSAHRGKLGINVGSHSSHGGVNVHVGHDTDRELANRTRWDHGLDAGSRIRVLHTMQRQAWDTPAMSQHVEL